MRAHDSYTETFTDDAAMVESLGHQVRVYEGAYTNLKVTTPEDLPMVEAALKASAAANLARTTPQATSR
jgi:2-C-methyl-D-erythritol 4-phosphate cytidylyltransferase